MQVAHAITVPNPLGSPSVLEIVVGDATTVEPPEHVDILAISCFPNDYYPTAGTLVRRLQELGVSTRDLAKHKHQDFLDAWHTWISTPISASIGIGRLACFEHGPGVDPAAVVGNVFRAIREFLLSSAAFEIGVLRLPLLATGNQQANRSEMLEAIITQAYTHMRAGLPVAKVQVVLYDREPNLHQLLVEAGIRLESSRADWAASMLSTNPEHDFFISYRRKEEKLALSVVKQLRLRHSSVRIFVDQDALPMGSFWKPRLVQEIHRAKRALCFITDDYPDSAECMDEFHSALCCSRYRAGFLVPILSLTNRKLETLPSSMRKINLLHAQSPPYTPAGVAELILNQRIQN